MRAAGDQSLSNGDADSASEQYGRLLALAASRGFADEGSGILDGAGRQKAVADALIAKHQADADRQAAASRQAAAAAADVQKAAERESMLAAEAKRREDADATQLRTISGRCWLRRGDGAVYDQRGITIYLLAPTLPAARYAETYRSIKNVLAGQVKLFRQSRDLFTSQLDNYNAIQKSLRDLQASVEEQTTHLELPTELVFSTVRASNAWEQSSGRMIAESPQMKELTSEFHAVDNDENWAPLMAAALISRTEADTSGGYRLQVGRGKYVIYAVSKTQYSIAEWAIAVDATGPGPQSLDLNNNNAQIVNRE